MSVEESTVLWRGYRATPESKRGTADMELRNGVYTSQTRKSDAEDIERIAARLLKETDLNIIHQGLEKIRRAARELASDLWPLSEHQVQRLLARRQLTDLNAMQ
jgi:hypothetical protein